MGTPYEVHSRIRGEGATYHDKERVRLPRLPTSSPVPPEIVWIPTLGLACPLHHWHCANRPPGGPASTKNLKRRREAPYAARSRRFLSGLLFSSCSKTAGRAGYETMATKPHTCLFRDPLVGRVRLLRLPRLPRPRLLPKRRDERAQTSIGDLDKRWATRS